MPIKLRGVEIGAVFVISHSKVGLACRLKRPLLNNFKFDENARVGRRELMLRHSVPHFPPNSRGIAF